MYMCSLYNYLYVTGDLCEILDCPGEPDCSNRGSCVRKGDQSVCLCNPGFTGEDCSELVCPGEPACNMRGKSCVRKMDQSVCLLQPWV